MNINQKQYNYLNVLLKNYELKKDINSLTTFEASIIIEGILNKGKVKNSYRDRLLSEIDYIKKQKFFDNLVQPKSKYATEKQMNYIKNLCETSNYKIINNQILREDASSIIQFLKERVHSDTVSKYLKEVDQEMLDKMIRVKEIKEEAKPQLPEDWILYNVEINGIVEF